MVAALAFAKGRLASAPAARTRLCAMAAIDSQAALALRQGHHRHQARVRPEIRVIFHVDTPENNPISLVYRG
jgi:hypothetical protein